MIYFGAGQFLCTVLKLTHRIYYKNFINIAFLTKYKLKIFFFIPSPSFGKIIKVQFGQLKRVQRFAFSAFILFFLIYIF